MLGLAAMFARMADEKRQADDDLTRYRMGTFEPPASRGPMPMRPPGQEGPMAPRGLQAMYGSPVVRGNIDVMNRPTVHNSDGSTSSVRSMSANLGGREVLMPTVSEDARIMNDDEAIDQYRRTGRHLGMFNTPEEATMFAGRLHDQQESLGDMRALSSGDMGPDARRARSGMAPRPRSELPMPMLQQIFEAMK